MSRYQLLRELGRGGCGIVWEARDTVLGRHVALKRLRRRMGRQRAHLRREAEVVARLQHPNIITLFDLHLFRGAPSLVMELLRGETLDRCLARGPLTPCAAVGIAVGVSLALLHAHSEGVLHRDLKPANVGVTAEGWVKVLDFGLARLSGEGLGPGGAGTPGFMAPEQLRGDDEDERTDVYGVGALLLVMLTCAPTGAGVRIQPGLARILSRAMAPSPRRRPSSIEALLGELLAWRPLPSVRNES
jgi:serine/threonine protein kinase